MKLNFFAEPIEYEDFIPGVNQPWGKDALLFRVNKGLGKLSIRYGRDKNGEPCEFLLLDNKPLINSYGDEMYCPTCAKVLSIGLGKENVTRSLIDTIKGTQDLGSDIREAFDPMKPMLSILEDGYYLLTRIETIPTDGTDRFFWNLTSSKKPYIAAAEVYYKLHSYPGTPRFLLPSQSLQGLNQDRVAYYRELIRNGKVMTGLAYYYDGFMSTLLDGHHRATAAYLENKTIDCLTIIKVTGLGYDLDKRPNRLYAGGKLYSLDLFQRPERIAAYLEKTSNSVKPQLEAQEVEDFLRDCKKAWQQEATPPPYDFGRRNYPDYLSIAFSDMADDTSNEQIEDVMGRRDEDAEFELEMIFKKLQLQEPERALKLARRILHDPNWRGLIEEVFGYYASIDSMEVEDLFIEYLINTEYDAKDPCRMITDEYLQKR
ncbi:hypothetical protein [Gorillibacterium sp. CAU 1737]|uniref:hypothetical protein n=1 Tax=Gorillibacterium sp. CAU 1737 TaxID=3140362 RepID=UPI0032619824